MQAPNDPRAQRAYDATEARQANPKKTNFRVLLASMTIAVVVGIVLVAAFWRTTPTAMDYSSGGKLEERTPTPQPTTPAPTAPATEAAPGSTSPPQQEPATTP